MKKVILGLAIVFMASTLNAKEYHVSKKGNDANKGDLNAPFLTIQAAADVAQPGDMITVHEGIYREWINPPRGGESDSKRITYRAAANEKVEIKGSEEVKGWKKAKDGVWKIVLPNSFFGDYNPFKDKIEGDWFNDHGRVHHTGEVFLNGNSFNEQADIKQVQNAEESSYVWYCESDDETTTIWANFHDYNPNKEFVEISTRRTCFYPTKQQVNFITIKGFEISQAATQWGAPTAEQIGMIATHWNKGWIIEDNIIHDSRCSGITLGKERATGHNVWSKDRSKDGSLHYIEVIFKTLKIGWNKDNIGSHVIRNNEIYHCEQTGICGSMGAAFSVIENNHIHDIWRKRQFSGAEIAGIKFHGAIDAVIKKNRIHNCGRGIWLDWMSQGARVSTNLMYDNNQQDLFLEVNHGPTLVDNNLLLSEESVWYMSQGTAYVHNLIAGQIKLQAELSRFTPYHFPHSTDVAGFASIYTGDDRFFNNIFVGNGENASVRSHNSSYGLTCVNKVKLPVWISGNIYFNGAVPSSKETRFFVDSIVNPNIKVEENNDEVYLEITYSEGGKEVERTLVTTETLGKAKMANQQYESADGSPIKFVPDYFGKARNESNPYPGPFAKPRNGKQRLKVW
ncbi:right-handed parallel beta-helix repeat-containing protein [Puteibacter caeruleilacunae]|nr:right-handed parallel beta-helix repeat-containing protein [Puteibacter caeruleilacunae]